MFREILTKIFFSLAGRKTSLHWLDKIVKKNKITWDTDASHTEVYKIILLSKASFEVLLTILITNVWNWMRNRMTRNRKRVFNGKWKLASQNKTQMKEVTTTRQRNKTEKYF